MHALLTCIVCDCCVWPDSYQPRVAASETRPAAATTPGSPRSFYWPQHGGLVALTGTGSKHEIASGDGDGDSEVTENRSQV